MRSTDDKPPGLAFRLHDRLSAGGWSFKGVAFSMGISESEVRFRWAGCHGVSVVPRKTWDSWNPISIDRCPSRLWPKEK